VANAVVAATAITTATTAVPAQGALTVKAVFDVPPAVARHPVSLHIGQFDYAGQAPAQTIDLSARTGCCAPAPAAPNREHTAVGPLSPDPVLG